MLIHTYVYRELTMYVCMCLARVSLGIYILINIIFMLGCQQTIENNTKYLVILGVFAFIVCPFAQPWLEPRIFYASLWRFDTQSYFLLCLGSDLALCQKFFCFHFFGGFLFFYFLILFCYRFCRFLFSSRSMPDSSKMMVCEGERGRSQA